MEKAVSSNKKSSMTMIVEGHQVALYFSDEPNAQIALKVKQALLGTCSERAWRRGNNSFAFPNVSVAILAVM